ncbi:MAG: phage tail tube protein [Selenomonadaceae bacterium]|nr:phage tail tube protein [Selenomonadaceae bacterium]
MKFKIQRFARDPEDVTYRGRRRWSGNHGILWLNGEKVFEHKSFEAKVVFNREDVVIGNSVDSKVVSLGGEGEIVIINVFNRGFSDYLEEQKAGHDPRFTIVAKHEDPDMLNAGKERIVIDNVTFDELVLMQFEKGTVRETTIPFKFTPEDAQYLETVEI